MQAKCGHSIKCYPIHMNDKAQNYGPRIRAFRTAKNLTQGELARLAGVDQAQISRFENCAVEGTPLQILAIARALGVTVSDIMGDKTAEPPSNAYQVSNAIDPRAAIQANYETPIGLRDLASDKALADALQITPEEWRRLSSVDLPSGVSKEGYMQLLITLRNIVGPTS